jgi:repressor LexA
LHFGPSSDIVFGAYSGAGLSGSSVAREKFTEVEGAAMPLTKRQREILNYLTAYTEQNGYAPSFEEIAETFQYSSLATVHEHLTNLQRKGYIRRGYNESRSIDIMPTEAAPRAIELPLLGAVAAGYPIEALTTGETVTVPDALVGRTGRHYVLRVRGMSMIDEQIRDGDFVIVNDRDRADNGEMVIALIDGSAATVKKYYRERDGRVRLQPANEAVTPMIVNENDLRIQGVVVGVLRRY